MTLVSERSSVRARRAGLYCGCLMLACGLWAPAVLGQEPHEARVAARKLAAEGTEAFERREFDRALELFEQASSLVQAPTIALMQARTLAELGRLGAAAERYEAAQRIDTSGPVNPAFRQAAEAAARELELLLPRIPSLRVKLVGSEAHGAEVAIDGHKLPADAAEAERRLDPGLHKIEVKTAAGTSSARVVTLAEGAREELVFSLEPVVRVPVAAVVEPQPSGATESMGAEPPVAAWVALGSGAAFAGMGVIFGILALGHQSDLDAVCKPGCPPAYEDDIDTYRTQRNLSYLGFALGAGGAAVGTYLLLSNAPSESTTAIRVSPTGLSLSRSFQ